SPALDVVAVHVLVRDGIDARAAATQLCRGTHAGVGATITPIELRIPRPGFANALGAMRDWLDRHGAGSVKFETATEDDGRILIRVEFAQPELAGSFAAEFGAGS